ncbi:YdcH family protein [Celeribacter litoreus]|uniref:YdcH family protein n=1 Tax=Celeribacter litoreus TaxID=2876714 RepID=UPI001CCA99F7|nr:YdcH family protein [Celeribacter litoreus]MCA0042957.1 YdcH family protein [Celeribacter litoreus]
MSDTPHRLVVDFPELSEQIAALKANDPHFARLVSDYDALNEEVHLVETDVHPMEDLAAAELRKKRMHLKDEIYKMLTTPA